MGEYRTGEFYDGFTAWQGEMTYCPPWPKKSGYTRMIRTATHPYRTETVKVVDLGSGPGQVAAICWHHGHRGAYLGYDFSPGSVAHAREMNKQFGHQYAQFALADIYEMAGGLRVDGNTMVMINEVLEHLERDLELLKSLPAGMPCVMDVPSFDAESHLRWFKDAGEVTSRYGALFDDWHVETLVHRTRAAVGRAGRRSYIKLEPFEWVYIFSGIKK